MLSAVTEADKLIAVLSAACPRCKIKNARRHGCRERRNNQSKYNLDLEVVELSALFQAIDKPIRFASTAGPGIPPVVGISVFCNPK